MNQGLYTFNNEYYYVNLESTRGGIYGARNIRTKRNVHIQKHLILVTEPLFKGNYQQIKDKYPEMFL